MYILSYLYLLLILYNENVNVNGASYKLFNKCDETTLSDCIDNWDCMWCNNSVIDNNTIVYEAQCNYISPCYFDQDNNNNCIIQNESKYDLQCKIGSILFYMLLIIGYYVSIIIIYGTLNSLISEENISESTKKSLNTLVLIITAVPLIVMFFINPLAFNFLFISYIIVGMCILCCIKIKDGNLNNISINKNSGYLNIT
jgi:hypothetical protein